jgi:hypothetical protein
LKPEQAKRVLRAFTGEKKIVNCRTVEQLKAKAEACKFRMCWRSVADKEFIPHDTESALFWSERLHVVHKMLRDYVGNIISFACLEVLAPVMYFLCYRSLSIIKALSS